MRRRDFVMGGAALPLVAMIAQNFAAFRASANENEATPFDNSTVRRMARQLAEKAYAAPSADLPASIQNLTYDQYRMIRFNSDRALWRDEGRRFRAEFFHRGFLFREKVEIFQVSEGKSYPVHYTPEMFAFDGVERPDGGDIGFSGFRLHGPINQPNTFDEICAFLGASYFRAVAKDQGYGISARGLSIKTGNATGEEFPRFRAFWIEQPAPEMESIVVHALLDSESTSAAFRFTIRPGTDTVFDTEASVYPRTDITEVGVATLTSMFYFDASDRLGVDDYRPAVHDSDGLLMWNGRGEQLWRPLCNPTTLQISAFTDSNPRGFGLMQRKRDFHSYEDLEARYERRPSVWIEPIGNWGEGTVRLVEIPTTAEIHDNIVAFWRPREVLTAGGEYPFNYRIHWCWENPWTTQLARVMRTRIGQSWRGEDTTRLFVLDVDGEAVRNLPADSTVRFDVSSHRGTVQNAVAQPNRETGGWRLSFELVPEDAPSVELRAQLKNDQGPLSEVWIYRWTP